jgi:hypothetical protein
MKSLGIAEYALRGPRGTTRVVSSPPGSVRALMSAGADGKIIYRRLKRVETKH